MTDEPSQSHAADDSVGADGTPFGRYRLIGLLGRGGMGEVWRAYDPATDRMVALKLLPESLSHDEVYQERFRNEAKLAAQLHNPHVVSIHFYGEIDGRLFVDMELIEGRDLETVLAEGPLEPGRAVRIVEQVARALHAAHKVKLVHRDVKPSNILLDDDDNAYLIDFGIARAAGSKSLTVPGGFIGSPRYMAPERFSAREADARADVYALACVLYECLTGDAPYPGGSFEQQYVGHVRAPLPRPSSADPDLSGFDRVTDKGLAKDPEQRYATTVDMARDAATVPIPASSPRVPQPVRPAAPPVPPAAKPEPGPTHVDETPNIPKVPPARPRGDWPAPRPAQEPTLKRSRRGGKIALVMGAAVLIVIAAAAAVAGTIAFTHAHRSSAGSSAAPRPQSLPGPQVVLPLAGLRYPNAVAVDASGTVYVVDAEQMVWKLAAGASVATKLPATGLTGNTASCLAVDSEGAVYVARASANKVLKMAAGATSWAVVSVNGLDTPSGLAVDAAGTLYIAGGFRGQPRVLKVPAGQTDPTVLVVPYAQPGSIALDAAGNVYVGTSGSGLWKLPAGQNNFVSLLREPNYAIGGVSVDQAGNVYFIDVNRNQVFKLPPGAATATPLPFTDIERAEALAVAAAGDVYLADAYANRVVKLPPA